VVAWRLLSLIAAILVVVIVFEMMRRGKLREKYAAIWLLLSVIVIVLGAVPGVVEWLSHVTHIITVSNFVLFAAIGVLGLVALHLSTEVGGLEEEVRTSVEETALLRCELDEVKRELEARIAKLEEREQAAADRHEAMSA
jgi:hypothetical protein